MEEAKLNFYLEKLANGKLYPFSELTEIPRIGVGVYTIWKNEELIYVGVSGRNLDAEIIAKLRAEGIKTEKGLITRLKAHASGSRSGDQFCVYIQDKFVLPSLTSEEIEAIKNGTVRLDRLIKEYINKHLFFRFVETDNFSIAIELENAIKNGGLRVGKPFLNPINS